MTHTQPYIGRHRADGLSTMEQIVTSGTYRAQAKEIANHAAALRLLGPVDAPPVRIVDLATRRRQLIRSAHYPTGAAA